MNAATHRYKRNKKITLEGSIPKGFQKIKVDGLGRMAADGDGSFCEYISYSGGTTTGSAPYGTPPSASRRTKSTSGAEFTRLANEINVFDMGFTRNTPIDWSKAEVPEKKELMALLESRVTTYNNPDVLVKIKNYEFRCHMMVLQSYSEFFADQNITRIELPEEQVSTSAFTYIYDWMIYKGQGSYGVLTRDNILEILSAVQYLKVKELEGQCWALIYGESAFNEEHAFLLYLDARRVNNTQVMESMVPRVRRFFPTLVASKEFVEMALEEVVVFLKSNFICVHCEMDVFMSGVRWLMHDWEARQRVVPQVMACVRFGLISPWNLIDIRRNKENREFLLVTGHPEVARMIDEGLAYAIVQYQHPRDTQEYRHATESLKLKEPQGRFYTATKPDEHKATPLYADFLKRLTKYKAWYLSLQSSSEEEDQQKRAENVMPDFTDLILLDN